ncbi:hypothetical protein [Halorubellus sp. PRR65]|uniref:hypothetical protein n=1 Tax=Halorubellus sp. PRR65 TaxID=3098148 RepID=UPI002B25D417|nr:hypothetical protein [Halorubellus sp. PRR65]
MRGVRILIGLLVVGSVVAVQPGAATGSPTATTVADSGPPETADEYLSAFQSMEGVPAFDRYTQFETIRSLAVSKLQVTEFDDATEREMESTLRLLRSFRDAYQAAQNGSTSGSLEAANRTLSSAESLNEQGLTYAPLADIAISRFYEDRGDEFLQAAANASRTPEQIEQLELASVAFRRAGASKKFSQVSLRYQSVRSEYQRNVETMNASASTASSFLASCSSCSDVQGALASNGLQTFEYYLQTGSKITRLRDAESLASKHGLSDRASSVASLREDVSTARSTLALASVGVLLVYGLVLAVVAMLVGHRLVTWSEAVQASQVGEIVMIEEVNDA